MRTRLIHGLATAVLITAVAATALAHPRGSVLANGGNSGSNASYILAGTVGQAAVGVSGSGSFILCHGFWCFGGSRTVSVDDGPGGGAQLPRSLEFGPPAPNPVRGVTRFRLGLPEAATVTLMVYDVAGRQIGEPAQQWLGAGYHQLYWSVPDGHPGVYFARLQVNGRVAGERRLVLVR